MNLHKLCIGIGIISLFMACASSSHSSDNFRERLDLSGLWQSNLGGIVLPTTVDEARLGTPNSDTTNSQRLTRLYPFVGEMFYQKEIDVPATFAGKHITLTMERTKPSTLWVDGDSVASLEYLLTPHVYDLTDRLTPGLHVLKIRIDNRNESVPSGVHGSHMWSDATQTNWNGILGDFYLEASARTYIQSVQVYPKVTDRKALLKIALYAESAQTGEITVVGHTWNGDKQANIPTQIFSVQMDSVGTKYMELLCDMGKSPVLWSEFSPALYRLMVTYRSVDGDVTDVQTVDFGMREFKTEGTQFSINGLRTFLRGTHDGCVFPLTGYAPMEAEDWSKCFEIAKSYGINHFRFHSWTPPRAAFEAADEAGIYLQVELPFWGEMKETNDTLNRFLMAEGEAILEAYGNHPSFTMMALGNELGGSIDLMRRFVDLYKRMDNRHLYAFGSNNYLGTAGQQSGEDFFVTCRVGRDVDSTYSTHVRSSFSFADAYKGGLLNGRKPATNYTYANAIAPCSVPVVSHESGQFQVYPDYAEIQKYTGVLYPYNFEIFRRRLYENGMATQAADFHKATGSFVALCYKADIELCLRTPKFGGFQLLDIKDYPGQGTALVGILDAFMETKNIIAPEKFREFCDRIVPMALFDRYCWSNADTLNFRLLVSNYSENALNYPFSWQIKDARGLTLIQKSAEFAVNQGEVKTMPISVSYPLNEILEAQKLTLELAYGDNHNQYDLWVYPQENKPNTQNIMTVHQLTQNVMDSLINGASVLYIPDHESIKEQSVNGTFVPDYWNYSMFKSISEWLKREVSPGTLSILTNPQHPLFHHFPTEMNSNWQWYSICKNARPLVLNGTPYDYFPIVQVVDNVERSHKLGMIFEFTIGKGRVLVSMCNLEAIKDSPEGRQFVASIYEYMQSESFKPSFSLEKEDFEALFTRSINDRRMIGVKNITSYE